MLIPVWNSGQGGQVCWDLLMAELKDKQKSFNAELSLETSEEFPFECCVGAIAYAFGHAAACGAGWEGSENEQPLQPKLSKGQICPSSLVSPLAWHCPDCAAGARSLDPCARHLLKVQPPTIQLVLPVLWGQS